jgi:flagellar biosynthesis/type III secretory pathway protein FliH
MEKEENRSIIHNAKIEGSVFYTQTSPESDTHPKHEAIAPKAKWREAEWIGYRRGLKEGQQKGYEAGSSEGFDLGFKQGKAAVQQELNNAVELLNKISSSLQSHKEEMFEQSKPELIRFALAICKQILRKELSDPANFTALLEKLFIQAKSILKDVPVDIVLAPEDLKMLLDNISAVGYSREELKKAHFIADPTMERGNCRLETALGLINFDIDRLMKDFEFKILEA